MTHPTLNIIHMAHRHDRKELFMRELAEQNITNYRVWDGVVHDVVFVAISTAHKRIVREAKTLGLPKVLIAEDDLRGTCRTSFQYYLDNEPPDYDIYLSSIYMGAIKEDNTTDDFSGLTLYMVHEKYYDKFLATPQMNHIDRAQAGRGKFVVCDPFTFTQWTTYSDNHKSIMQHDVWMQGRKLYNDKNLEP